MVKFNLTELPSWLKGKESACNARDPGSIPGSGRYPGEGNGNPFQYSCLKNSMDKGAWQAAVCGVERVGLVCQYFSKTNKNILLNSVH